MSGSPAELPARCLVTPGLVTWMPPGAASLWPIVPMVAGQSGSYRAYEKVPRDVPTDETWTRGPE